MGLVLWLTLSGRNEATPDHQACSTASEVRSCLQRLILQAVVVGGVEKEADVLQKGSTTTRAERAKLAKKTLPGAYPQESENPSLAPAVAGAESLEFCWWRRRDLNSVLTGAFVPPALPNRPPRRLLELWCES